MVNKKEMMEIEIHLDKEIFEEVTGGKKKFEIRLGNKNIGGGDLKWKY